MTRNEMQKLVETVKTIIAAAYDHTGVVHVSSKLLAQVSNDTQQVVTALVALSRDGFLSQRARLRCPEGDSWDDARLASENPNVIRCPRCFESFSSDDIDVRLTYAVSPAWREALKKKSPHQPPSGSSTGRDDAAPTATPAGRRPPAKAAPPGATFTMPLRDFCLVVAQAGDIPPATGPGPSANAVVEENAVVRRLRRRYSGMMGAKVIWLAAFTLAPLLVPLNVAALTLQMSLASVVYAVYHGAGVLVWLGHRQLCDDPRAFNTTEKQRHLRRLLATDRLVSVLNWIVVFLIAATVLVKVRFTWGERKIGLPAPAWVHHVLGVPLPTPPPAIADDEPSRFRVGFAVRTVAVRPDRVVFDVSLNAVAVDPGVTVRLQFAPTQHFTTPTYDEALPVPRTGGRIRGWPVPRDALARYARLVFFHAGEVIGHTRAFEPPMDAP